MEALRKTHARTARLASALALVLMAAIPVRADDGPCTMPQGFVFKYWPLSGSPTSDSLCDKSKKTGKHDDCHLSGWLYYPKGGRGHELPAIIYVHGSGATKNMTQMCAMVEYFSSAGYVVFVPYLRGYSDSTSSIWPSDGKPRVEAKNPTWNGSGFENSGDYIGDSNASTNDTIRAMKDEVDHELQFALDFLVGMKDAEKRPLVDPRRIALTGHSYGGATVTLAADADLHPQPAAIVDISGGVLSWPGDPQGWHDALTKATRARKMPMYMLQTLNESKRYTDNPASPSSLADAMASTVDPFIAAQLGTNGQGGAEMAVFTAVPDLVFGPPWCLHDDPPNQCAHTTFFKAPSQVDRWAPTVKDFLEHYGIKP